MLAAKLFDVECHQVEHRPVMERKGNDISILFQSVAPNVIGAQLEQQEALLSNIPPPSSDENLTFGHRLETHSTDFIFNAEIQ